MAEAVHQATVLINAHRAEFLQECTQQGMIAAEAAQCLSDFEDEALAEDELARPSTPS